MYLSIRNVGHKDTKYVIVDKTEELNLPDIPSGYTFAFQELYTNNIKVLSDQEFKDIFSNNTLLYEIVGFNNSFKIEKTDIKKLIKDEIIKIISSIFKITSSFILNRDNLDIVDFINSTTNGIYNKNEIDDLCSSLQNKINEINEDYNFIENEIGLGNKEEINQFFNNIDIDIKSIKSKINYLKNL